MNASRKLSSLLLLPLAGAAANAIAADGLVYGNVSGWTVLTDPNRAYHCAAEVQYEGGTLVRIGYDAPDGELYLSIADPAWRGIAADVEHSTRISFDDEDGFTAAARGLGQSSRESGGIRLDIPPAASDGFVSDFMQRDTLTIAIEGRAPVDLSLAGSLRATELLRDCQSTMSQHRNAAP